MRLSGRRREERIRFVQQGRDTDPFHVVLGKFKFWEGWLGIEFDNRVEIGSGERLVP